METAIEAVISCLCKQNYPSEWGVWISDTGNVVKVHKLLPDTKIGMERFGWLYCGTVGDCYEEYSKYIK